jgi:hypothetical protein
MSHRGLLSFGGKAIADREIQKTEAEARAMLNENLPLVSPKASTLPI